MVVWEVVEMILDFLGYHGRFGVALAAVGVGVYYARELAGFMRALAAWTWMLSLVVGLVGAALIGGLALGVIDVNGSLVGQLAEILLDWIGGI